MQLGKLMNGGIVTLVLSAIQYSNVRKESLSNNYLSKLVFLLTS